MKLTPPDRFLRLVRPPDSPAPAEIGRRQIYIFPTKPGLVFGVLVMLLLAGSMNYGNNLGFMLAFLLAALGLVATLHTWRNLLGLQLTPGKAEPVFAGQDARFEILLHNPSGGPRPGIRLEMAGVEPVETDLTPRASASLHLTEPSANRGLLRLGRFMVSSRYPLGLLRSWCYVELESDCMIYPAPGPKMPASDTPDYSHSQQGDKGIGVDDFVGIRPYRSGDSLKHINWKSLAREQGLQTKQFGGDRSEKRWLDWTALSGLDAEAKLSRLCRGVLDACDTSQEFGLRLPGVEIPPSRGQKHRHQCLQALALYGVEP
ncbi:MAG: DUF58 domain-containing protein [Chromatiales bacterium]|nr:DUF58 domain-containing protein [Chromatiales bacterium]